ncbi:MAG: bifunctional diaminohydroxyphosphoribosylaminopyrimidine deaminase/5-amino-6-(5-phosphoribosylamino)uracil reductase RibD [Lachnospiraceae bacterium]|nr:bifunctional diaminohydroxyphosphoribosylaminopyrimidine deaminase/5-amino-6-(5-phosphoribosylamino)uracil reductase RibD [Lachnospiraceae bacterium]
MTDQDYMRRAISLAKNGIGRVNPNPLVGAVIVKDGRIIGEGYHARYGDLHAERAAIKNLTESAEGATIYVTLEPCCHYGKQPPCTEAILEQKIARVVVGSRDPNPLVAGKGAAILREAGVVVEEDFLREECDALNPVFFHFITTKRPYVRMKYAMTADGKIATRTGASKWITGEAARGEVQRMRIACTGIMAGIGTVLADDPMLNVRIEGERSPIRIICDSSLRIPLDCQLVKTVEQVPVIVACAYREEDVSLQKKQKALEEKGLLVWNLPNEEGKVDLPELMRRLGERNIDSVLLEGGGILNDSALRAGIVSEVNVFIAPKLFGGAEAKSPVEGMGVTLPAEAVMMQLDQVEQIGEDLLLRYRIRR